MKPEEREAIRDQLKKKLIRIDKEIIELKDLTVPEAPDCAIGRVSRMDAINNRSVNEAALRKKQDQQRQIKFALTQIDLDSFGKCVSCGNEIPIGRILLMPESIKCVRCASR